MAKIDQQLAGIATMAAVELDAQWQSSFGEAAPVLPPSLLRRALAYHAQEQAFGGLPASVAQMLDGLTDSPSMAAATPEICLKAGTRLLREWNGTVHAVLVLDTGFEWSGARYRSLSEIARKITGAHWSGPRFFGLKRRGLPPSRSKEDHG
ncbi:MAG: DUF2924 domain-containing protein [Sphingomonadaceae bacterium]